MFSMVGLVLGIRAEAGRRARARRQSGAVRAVP